MAGTCTEYCEDLSSYLDNELDSARKADISGHLLECDQCRRQYDDLKAVSNLFAQGSSAGQGLAIPDLWEQLSASMPSVCEVIQEDLSAYLDGELPLAAQEGINEHLKQCGGCQQQLKRLNLTNQFISKGLELPAAVPVDLWDGIKSRINADCALIRGELSVFVDQEVATLRHRAVTGHLLECPDCQREFNDLSQVGELIRTHFQPEIPADFDLWPEIKRSINVIPLHAGASERPQLSAHASRKQMVMSAVAALVIGLTGTLAYLVSIPGGKSIQPVSAEAYLLEQAMTEPSDSAEAVVYENQ